MILIRQRHYRPPGTPRSADQATADQAPSPPSAAEAEPAGRHTNPAGTQSLPADDAPAKTREEGQPAPEAVEAPGPMASAVPSRVLPALAPTPAAAAGSSSTEALAAALRGALGDRYAVLQPIAIGGMAVIFQLRHQRTGGLFVAKVMRPELLGEPALRDAFAREARVGARLAGHPNAVAVLDADDTGPNRTGQDGTGDKGAALPFLLMPYIDGEDLDQLLHRRGRLDRDEAMMLLAQLGSLLMYAETERIVHADVALGNIRLDRFGQYRLLDYGLARGPGDRLDALHAAAGTPAYNSPEQLRGQPLDIRSDLYSLGLVFFHALTGRPAFPTTDLGELRQAHLAGSWQLPEEFAADPPVAALLGSLLAVDRDRRMASAFELSGAMSALGYDLPSCLRSLSDTAITPRMRRQRLERA